MQCPGGRRRITLEQFSGWPGNAIHRPLEILRVEHKGGIAWQWMFLA